MTPSALRLGAAFLLFLPALASAESIPNFPTADLVLGQPDFTSNTLPAAPSATNFEGGADILVDPATGKVFLSDTSQNRVLRYPSATTLLDGAAAEAVFGQPDFTTDIGFPPTASRMNSPLGLALDAAGNLWVADADNHRVLRFPNALTAANGSAANLVLGQPDFDSATPGTAANLMNAPSKVFIDPAGRLWVSELGNNRVLRFDNAATRLSGDPASGVLGQPDFVTNTPGSDALKLDAPFSLTVDPRGTLWVADTNNNRILGYPSAATISNGTNAARVLGQPDFNTNPVGLSAARLTFPTGLFADSTDHLWVLDQGNSRALRFSNLSAIANGGPADRVVGQPDFDSALAGVTADRLDSPNQGIFIQKSTGQLWINDSNVNNRALRFSPVDDAAPTVTIKGKRRIVTRRARLTIRGTATDDVAVTRVFLRISRQKNRPALGTTTWRRPIRLEPGRTVIRAFAFDASGKRSTPARAIRIRR